MFMFGAFLTAPVPNRTGPHQDRPAAGSDIIRRATRVLWLIRTLMDYGRQLANALRNATDEFDLGQIKCNFGTIDIARIIARITYGLRLAAALEERLMERLVHPSAPRAASVRRVRTAASRNTDGGKPEATVFRLLTDAEIAAHVRQRPVGAVVSDICRFLGIVQADPLWPDITFAVLENGGSIIDLVMNTFRRMAQGVIEAFPDVDFGPLPFAARYRVVSGAGPP